MSCTSPSPATIHRAPQHVERGRVHGPNRGRLDLGHSPDGLVGDDGLLEIKAPRAKAHVLAVSPTSAPHYMAQLQAGLLVSGRAWIDFVPFCGGLRSG